MPRTVRSTLPAWLDRKAMDTYRAAGVEAGQGQQGSPEEVLRCSVRTVSAFRLLAW
jgi:hypothetical protein